MADCVDRLWKASFLEFSLLLYYWDDWDPISALSCKEYIFSSRSLLSTFRNLIYAWKLCSLGIELCCLAPLICSMHLNCIPWRQRVEIISCLTSIRYFAIFEINPSYYWPIPNREDIFLKFYLWQFWASAKYLQLILLFSINLHRIFLDRGEVYILHFSRNRTLSWKLLRLNWSSYCSGRICNLLFRMKIRKKYLLWGHQFLWIIAESNYIWKLSSILFVESDCPRFRGR